MINNSFYLYPNLVNAYSIEFGFETTQRFRNVYQRNIKISRGVDNYLDFNIKNQDQKNIDITDDYLVLTILNPETQELLLRKDGIQTTDSSYVNGRVRFNITKTDVATIEPGYYQISLVKENRTYIDVDNYVVDSSIPFYINTNFDMLSTLEVLPGIDGEPKPSFVIEEFTEEWRTNLDEDPVYYSSIINANPELSTPSSIHTFAFYTTGYVGDVVIEASLDDGGSPKNWVEQLVFTPSETLEFKNVEGKFNYFRIKNSPTEGSLDKIIYRS